MGACLSSSVWTSIDSSAEVKQNSALVISIKGDLRHYPIPVTVNQVLQTETSSFFVCNSDSLYYDDFMVALDLEDELDAGQIYFVLPTAKLQYRLSASDMAALAVKASVALNSSTTASSYKSKRTARISISSTSENNVQKRKNKSRISPFVVTESNQIDLIVDEKRLSSDHHSKQLQTASFGVSRSGSIRKLQRLSSRKARLAVRSFRLRLSTIYESSDPQLY